MRIALIGSQDFGKATLEAFLERGDEVVAVFCPPDHPKTTKPEILKETALARGLNMLQFPRLNSPEALKAMRDCNPDICVMAYVLQTVPQELTQIPRLGTIQYHPSLLPRYRGPSAIGWSIALGESKTGLSIFRPSDGLDEGKIIIQKEVPIGPDDTLGQIYFNHLFPLGIKALLETTDLVAAGQHQETVQDESQANYEGWFDQAAARIHWTSHVSQIYNLIRACNPAPGAWTMLNGEKIHIYDVRKHLTPTFASVCGKPGELVEINQGSFKVACHGGQIEVLKIKAGQGSKISGGEFASTYGIQPGQFFDAS